MKRLSSLSDTQRRTSLGFGLVACCAITLGGCGDVLGFDEVQIVATPGDEGETGGSGGDSGGAAGEPGTNARDGGDGEAGPSSAADGGGGASGASGGGGAGGTTGGGGTENGVGGAGGAGGTTAGAPLATGIQISQITLYQAVAIPLMQNGKTISSKNAPIVAGRDAMLRVSVAPAPGWSARSIAAQVDYRGSNAPTSQSKSMAVYAASSESSLGTTFNFDIPGANVTPDLAVAVSLRETTSSGTGTSDGAQWPTTGTAPLGALSSNGNVHIVIVPFQYNADGSGRTPDTSQAQMDLFRKRFYSTYPAPNTEITVHAPVPFGTMFSANGQGWSQLLNNTCALRQQERPAKNVYYHGILAPSVSFAQFCGNGCVAGLANLTTNPNDDYGRCSIGLGFTGKTSADTALHEVAHALGRPHAPCGNPDGVDPNFPYAGASIGSWGYDLSSKQLQNPSTFKDFMAYCTPVWISDYTYGEIFTRISYVNSLADYIAPPGSAREWRVAMIEGDGTVTWGSSIHLSTPPSGTEEELPVLDGGGNQIGSVKGYFYPYSDLPGGTILVPERDASAAVNVLRLPGGRVLPY